jgi:hypothetical protein
MISTTSADRAPDLYDAVRQTFPFWITKTFSIPETLRRDSAGTTTALSFAIGLNGYSSKKNRVSEVRPNCSRPPPASASSTVGLPMEKGAVIFPSNVRSENASTRNSTGRPTA